MAPARAQLAACQRYLLLVLLIVLAAPFYNGGMLVGTFLLTGVIFLASQSVRQMLWRLTAGVYVMACCAALGFSDFFAGAQAYTARFSGLDRLPLQFHWPVVLTPEVIASTRQGLCAWGVVCDRLDQWPLALTGSSWLQVSILAGAIAVAIRMRPPLARIGALFAALWLALLMIWIGASVGVITAPPLSPVYFYLTMYPFWAFFSLYAGLCLIDLATRASPCARGLPIPAWVCGALCVAAVALVPLFHAQVSRVFKWSGVPTRAATPITQALGRRSRCGPVRPFAGRSPLCSVRRGVRCGSDCSETPIGRCSRKSLKNFCRNWPSIPATRTTCSICGGSIFPPCRNTARACPSP